MAYRLGLKPWEAERCQPVDLAEMLEGWRWRFSREAEPMLYAAVMLANGQPRSDAVILDEFVRAFPDYMKRDS